MVVAIRLSGSTCEKQYDELSDDTNDMDVVEVDLSPGLLAGSTTLPYLPAPLSGDVGAGTISMTTIRKTYKQNIYYGLCVWFVSPTNDLPAIIHNITVVTAHHVGGVHIIND